MLSMSGCSVWALSLIHILLLFPSIGLCLFKLSGSEALFLAVLDTEIFFLGLVLPYPPGHNPHAHILLTVRPLDEKGKWQYKTEKEYLCVKNGKEQGFTCLLYTSSYFVTACFTSFAALCIFPGL